ncbi:MAG TPA: 3-deoxy-7-phosphoheptulonate synthase, partial [bacterium]|nr:3-deoxy-7-phosphoheptulonate synthase [bacterium]
AGHRQYVTALSLAALAAGADGLMVEVHPDPARAVCDGQQALTPDDFSSLMRNLRTMADALKRRL